MFSSEAWLSNSSGFYNNVATQSLRFDDGSSAYLSRTPSSAGNKKTFTFSTWIKRTEDSTNKTVFDATDSTYQRTAVLFQDKLVFYNQASPNLSVQFDPKLRDPSSWYHIVVAVDTTQSTSSNRIKGYVNGTQLTTSSTMPSLNQEFGINGTGEHMLGAIPYAFPYERLNGYLSETNLIDGLQLDPTYFGETKNGVWIAKQYSGSYGTNGFRLEYKNTSVGTGSSSTIGADTSGNSHHFTSGGIVASDCNMPDSPENNFSTLLGSLSESSDYQSYAKGTYSEGALKVTGISGWTNGKNNFLVNSGKWYAEVRVNAWVASHYVRIGVFARPARTYNEYFWLGNGTAQIDSTSVSSRVGTFALGDVLQIAIDLENNNIFFGKNNTWQNSATQAEIEAGTSTNAFASGSEVPTGDGHYYGIYGNPHSTSTNISFNFGQDSSFAGTETAQGNTDDNDIGDFYYAPPSGFLALCTANLPEPTISPNATTQADDYFNTVLYTGNGSTDHNITGVGFQPDFVWLKERSSTSFHQLLDVVRGAGVRLESNVTNAETTPSPVGLSSFDADGFTVENNNGYNENSQTYVSWNWKAGGTAVSNTDGTITSSVSANTDAGFSIVSYTGNGSTGQSVGTGLPSSDLVIIKNRSATASWHVLTGATTPAISGNTFSLDSGTNRLNLNLTNGYSSYGMDAQTNVNGNNYIAYCFHSVEGYSKMGSYTGNGSTDGTFVYTGFRPAFIIYKKTSGTGNWGMLDNTRSTFNLTQAWVGANLSNAESNEVTRAVDFLSNGFKAKGTNADLNTNSATYIYMAFAEAPFKYANAR